MANRKHLKILKQGVHVWNEWRAKNPGVVGPDLRFADLSRADLIRVDLRFADLFGAYLLGANLREAYLLGAYLSKAELKGSDLFGANLCEANLSRADLGKANLGKANLIGATLSEANLCEANLIGATLSEANLEKANLIGATLSEADLEKANLIGANLREANLEKANLVGSNLREANLEKVNLIGAKLSEADLRRANLTEADLTGADLFGADLREADLRGAYLTDANLMQADLRGTNLVRSVLVGTKIDRAKLSGSSVYAVNVWDLEGEFEEQKDLVITPEGDPVITVDNIKVAQFVYLILNNEEIRDVINTLTSKSVLILGRFAIPERKAILDALKNKLREYNLLPIVFDFDRPTDKDFTETSKTLAGLAYFVIADITNPKSSPLELQATVPDYQIPFVPIIQEGEQPFAMMVDLQKKYNWVLDTLSYNSIDTLIKALKPAIIDPAIQKHNELRLIKAQEPKIRSANDFIEDKGME